MADRDIPDTEELAGSSTERDVGAREVVDRRLGEHGVVLKLGLAERGAVAGNEDKLSCEPRMRCGAKQGRAAQRCGVHRWEDRGQ